MFNDELRIYKHDAIKIAEQLAYPERVIIKLQKATSTSQITSIMTAARLRDTK